MARSPVRYKASREATFSQAVAISTPKMITVILLQGPLVGVEGGRGKGCGMVVGVVAIFVTAVT